MARLFIVGNGYDVSRRGDTRYSDFKNWLETKYINRYKNIFAKNDDGMLVISQSVNPSSYPSSIFSIVETKDQKEKDDMERITREITFQRKFYAILLLFNGMRYLGDDLWCCFEDNLSKLQFEKITKEVKNIGQSSMSFVDRKIDALTSLNPEVNLLFAEWIQSLRHKKIKKKGFELKIIDEINATDVFIIFNYTDTIERIFNKNNSNDVFFHIHGIFSDANSIVFGHNDKNKSKGTYLDSEEDYCNESYAGYYKNPEAVIKKHDNLWNKIETSEPLDIYEFGWSCSNVDSDYIKQIVELRKSRKTTLYLNNHDNKGFRKKAMWIKYGFPENSIKYYVELDDNISFLDS